MSRLDIKESDESRVQIPIDAKTLEKIDELAKRMKVGRGRMAAMLLRAGIKDNEWLINVVTSELMKPVADAIRQWDKKRDVKKKTKSRKAGG